MSHPSSPSRKHWTQRALRLPDETWREVHMKLASDREKLQSVLETCVQAWLADVIDMQSLRKELKARGVEPL